MKTARFASVSWLILALLTGGAALAADGPGSLSADLATIKRKQLVDLTHSFSPVTPAWSGFGQAIMSAAAGPKMDRIPLGQMILPLVVLDPTPLLTTDGTCIRDPAVTQSDISSGARGR